MPFDIFPLTNENIYSNIGCEVCVFHLKEWAVSGYIGVMVLHLCNGHSKFALVSKVTEQSRARRG